MSLSTDAAKLWDREYATGRYQDEPPIAFVHDILTAARAAQARTGIYIGCGNGRNYLPLLQGGLDLVGLDISQTAIQQLRERLPSHPDKLLHGDLSVLPTGITYQIVIGIQVFQHGNRATAHDHVRAARERVAPGGIMAVRVNAIRTDVQRAHEIVERDGPEDGFTVRYQAGPKAGLDVRFFARQELLDLFDDGFEMLVPVRSQSTVRQPPGKGQWTQWEGIWRRL